ncbi:NADH dehydrogenase [ubiquinone] 1 beta subcomplex subunit 7-like [Diorhabda carinulata]|uniref:NADH dehydrogenase [ubiquinone] 1 beta subcomplex subunit 7-like n=1 Tax=Diorhabda carinulata TaxID=1163345 RepID=UPI0025A1E0A4|nr:NADH dehydrogenase [ubiquinone] 1 beta subcomplex subunit 7-like [Diorhabda carinulata]
MGQLIGHTVENGFNLYYNPEIMPSPLEDPTYDPLKGFNNGRKPRAMVATEDEMRSAKVPLEDRDYCAHLLLKFFKCRKENWPFVINCKHEKHEYLECKYEDFIIRMKEFEREKRLRSKYGGPCTERIDNNKNTKKN